VTLRLFVIVHKLFSLCTVLAAALIIGFVAVEQARCDAGQWEEKWGSRECLPSCLVTVARLHTHAIQPRHCLYQPRSTQVCSAHLLILA